MHNIDANMIHFKDTKNKSALSTRWLQMTKQEQIIEKKKMEIQAKLEAQKQAAALAAQAKLTKYVFVMHIVTLYLKHVPIDYEK